LCECEQWNIESVDECERQKSALLILFRDIITAKSSANVRSARVIVRLKLQRNVTVRSILEQGAVVSLGEK